MRQNAPPGMQNFKITWGPGGGNTLPHPPPAYRRWRAALMLRLLKIFLLLLFYKLKTLKYTSFPTKYQSSAFSSKNNHPKD